MLPEEKSAIYAISCFVCFFALHIINIFDTSYVQLPIYLCVIFCIVFYTLAIVEIFKIKKLKKKKLLNSSMAILVFITFVCVVEIDYNKLRKFFSS